MQFPAILKPGQKRSSHTHSGLSFKHPRMKTQWDLPFCKLICSLVCILKVERFWWAGGWVVGNGIYAKHKGCVHSSKTAKPFSFTPQNFQSSIFAFTFIYFVTKFQGIYYELINLARQRVGVTSDLNPIILSRIIRIGVHLVGWI